VGDEDAVSFDEFGVKRCIKQKALFISLQVNK